jgi:curli biogenesis system outer membrane secretion channel CsgG
MRCNYFQRIIVLAIVGLLCVSCAQYNLQRRFIRPPFDHSFIKKIAVVEFSNYSGKRDAGRIIADRIEQQMVNRSDYEVISRMQLKQILREHRLSAKGVLSPSTARRIGKLAGVDALVVGNVEKYELKTRSWDKRYPGETTRFYKREALIVFTFKVLNTTTGQVVFAKTTRGNWGKQASEKDMDYLEKQSDYEYMENALKRAMYFVQFIYPHYRYDRVRVK